MKKKLLTARYGNSYIRYRKILLIMRLTLFLFFLALVQTIASNSYSQEARISIELKNTTVNEVLNIIEDQTDYFFLYNNQLIDVNRRVSVRCENEKIENVLDRIFQGTDVKYIIRDRQIILTNQASKEIEVTGKIVDSSGTPLPGVSVAVKGTTTGTITNMDGVFLLKKVPADAALIFSFVGMDRQEIPVDGKPVINVTMTPSSIGVEEVVVTALGISRESKSLGYSVGKVEGEDLTNVAQENMINSLAGKMAGVEVSSTGSAGSSVSIVIRGATSLAGDNQPLFVIDGIPVNNKLSGNTSQIGDRNVVDYGNAISDLNTDDIESISVLKGPSAAALYGSRAGNGVILITTKTGKKNSKIKVSVSSSTVFDMPYKYLPYHHLFATGVRPEDGTNLEIDESSTARLGPRLDVGNYAIQWSSPYDDSGNQTYTELVSHPNNVKNFVQTGITSDNSIAIDGGTDKSSYRVSYSNMLNRGIVPGSDLQRNTLNLTGKYDLSSKLTLSTNITLSRSESDNRPAGNRGTNPLEWAYKVSSHIDIRDLKNYWAEGQEQVQQYQVPDHDNPYFLAHAVKNSFFRDRVFGNMKLDWQLTKDISLMGRYSLDVYNEQRETKIPYSYSYEAKGSYGVQKLYSLERNIDFLATYKKDINDLSVSVSGGGNAMYRYYSSLTDASVSGGDGLTVPGVYTIENISPLSLDYSSSYSKKAIYSLYALANIGYRDMVYLDLTARNDWSSTLPENNRSYFYPSASLSLLLNHIFELPETYSLAKLRAGVAQVGNDTDPYQLSPVLENLDSWNGVSRLSVNNSLLSPNLKPEIATSYEFGADLYLFKDRIRLEGTWYQVDNKNQILSLNLPNSSGYGSKMINAGMVQSRGIELGLGFTPLKMQDLRWDVNMNFSRNRTKIKRLTDGVDYYKLWSDAKGGAYTWVGDNIGAIYDRPIVRVEDKASEYYGWPLLDSDGAYQSKSGVGDLVQIGNFNPDFTLGVQSSVSYKRFILNFSIDWRHGGDFVSQTLRYAESDMATSRFLKTLINPNKVGDVTALLKSNPDKYIKKINIVGGPTAEMGGYPLDISGWVANDGVFNAGVYGDYDDKGNLVGYVENLGGNGTKLLPLIDNYPWDFTRPATFDASFVKLREISFGYQLPASFTHRMGIQGATFSVYSRNIILWTKAKIAIDPETAFQPEGNGTFKQGIERYNITPWTIPVGFKLAFNF